MKKRPHPQIICIFGVMVQSLHIFGYCLHLWPCFWTITREPRPKFHVSEFFSHCFKVFNPCKSSKQRSTTQNFSNYWENSLFYDTNEKQAKLWTRIGSRPLRSNIARKTCIHVAFFVFCRSNMTSLMGENSKIRKKKHFQVTVGLPKVWTSLFLQKLLSSKIQGCSDYNS